MYLKIDHSWQLDIGSFDDGAINWDRADSEAATALVYGHPYHSDDSQWVSARRVLDIYAAKGLDVKGELDGVYTVFIIDKPARQCHVIVDRYGINAMFLAVRDDQFVISDTLAEAASLSGASELNAQSVLEHSITNYIHSSRTLIKGIDVCEPATVYHIGADLKVSTERYWDLQGAPASDALSDDEWRERYNAHVGGIVDQADALSMPLTGGIDTRTVFSACLGAPEKLHCWTHGRPGSPDIRLARRISDHFGAAYNVHELGDEWVGDFRAAFEADAGIINGMAGTMMLLHAERSFRREHNRANVLMSGVMGNEIWRCAYSSYVKGARNAGEIADRLVALRDSFTRRGAGDSLKVFNASVTGDPREVLRATMDEEVAAAPDPNDWLSVIERFSYRTFCWKWCGLAMQAAGKYFKVFPGLLQKDLVPRIALLPIERRNRGDIQRLIIDGNDRFLGNLALDKSGYIRPTLRAKIRAARQKMLYYIDGGCRRVLGMRGFLSPGVNRLDWLRPHAEWLQGDVLAYDKMRTRELFDRAPYEQAIGAFFEGNNKLGPFILHLVSLEMYFKHIGWRD